MFLSDGRTLTERNPELQRIDRAGVTIAGRRYAFIRPQNVRQPVDLRPPLDTQPADPGSRSEAPAEAPSAWRTDSDGVQRLKQPLTW
jgi:hypothetical protein